MTLYSRGVKTDTGCQMMFGLISAKKNHLVVSLTSLSKGRKRWTQSFRFLVSARVIFTLHITVTENSHY